MTAREYLFSLEQFGIKLGLDQIRALVARLDRPDTAFRSVVVAGTNGKGSVTAMAERALRAAGCRTGRYTSPHLVAIEERIGIDGRPIDSELFDALAAEVRHAAADLPTPPTFFEATTALALEAFRRAAVDVAVLEVGLGGRLDATNVLLPEGVAITAIDFDHRQYLGDTLQAIAAEKAGVAKPGRFCVLQQNRAEVREVVARTCQEHGARLIDALEGVELRADLVEGRTRLALRTPAADYGDVTLALRGRHQIDNAVTAVRLVEAFAEAAPLFVSIEAIRAGLQDVEWPGRLELRHAGGRAVLIDGAHNPAAARALAAYLTETYATRLPMVLGIMRDKDIAGIAAPLAACASVVVCTATATPRAASPDEIAATIRHAAPDVPVVVEPDPMTAVSRAASQGSPAVVAGSLYLVGEIRAKLS